MAELDVAVACMWWPLMLPRQLLCMKGDVWVVVAAERFVLRLAAVALHSTCTSVRCPALLLLASAAVGMVYQQWNEDSQHQQGLLGIALFLGTAEEHAFASVHCFAWASSR